MQKGTSSALHVREAYERIKSTVKQTPMDFSSYLSEITGMQLYLKKEHLSLTSSYKERGALNKMLLLSEEERKRGVICASAGNHAQAVSYHSSRLGIRGLIVMPVNTPHVKVSSTKRFGGTVLLHGDTFDDALQKAKEICEEEKMTFMSAFDDHEIVAGQGTVAIEMLKSNPFIDAVVVPVGGGGLIAGMALLLKDVNPRIKIYGVESNAVPSMYESLKAGEPVRVTPKTRSIADGIAVLRPGAIPFQIVKNLVDDIVLVEETEIARAVMVLLEREKTLCEGAGATALAAILSNKLPQLVGKQVGVVLTGGNIDMAFLGRIIEKGLVADGRIIRLRVIINDAPGNLAKIVSLISDTRANIRDLSHERAFAKKVGVTQTENTFTLDIRDHDHLEEIEQVLKKHNYQYSLD